MKTLIAVSLLALLVGCSTGGNNKDVGVTPNQSNTVTINLPAGATPEQLAALPTIKVGNTMVMSDSPFKVDSEQEGGASPLTTRVPLDLQLEVPDDIKVTPGTPVVIPTPTPEPEKPPVVVVPTPEPEPEPEPEPPTVGEWEILETYDNLSSPDNIDPGRSFSWLQSNTGDKYPKPIRLRWPACNYSCVIDDPAHDYNYKVEGGRDMSKCSWYSAMDGTDHHTRGSFFSRGNPACVTSVGYIEKRI